MSARDTVEAYYDALRAGDPLGNFFGESPPERDDTVKFGISERLVGVDDIQAGLRSQTNTTTDWVVESRALRVTDQGCHAWFSDDVRMEWTDTQRETRVAFDTRWSGTLRATDGDWTFVGMHVSTADEL